MKDAKYLETTESIWENEDIEDSIFYSMYLGAEEEFFHFAGRKYTFRDNIFAKVMGCYFPPVGRVFLGDQIDVKNDGLPQVCCLSGFNDFFRINFNCFGKNPRLSTCLIHKIKRLPQNIKSIHKDSVFYKLIFLNFFDDKLPENYIDRHGVIELTGSSKINTMVGTSYIEVIEKQDRVLVCKDIKHSVLNINRDVAKELFCATLCAHEDRKYLWNVLVPYKVGSLDTFILFGVNEDHIKSLFYARETPVTISGRKRPIQHWVRSHNKRLKNGIDIEINKYLRGITEFEMFNNSFKIISPNRKQECDDSLKQRNEYIKIAQYAPTYSPIATA